MLLNLNLEINVLLKGGFDLIRGEFGKPFLEEMHFELNIEVLLLKVVDMLLRPRPVSDGVDRNGNRVSEYTFSWSRRVRFVADLEAATLCRDLVRVGWGVVRSSSSDHFLSFLGVSRTSASSSSPP